MARKTPTRLPPTDGNVAPKDSWDTEPGTEASLGPVRLSGLSALVPRLEYPRVRGPWVPTTLGCRYPRFGSHPTPTAPVTKIFTDTRSSPYRYHPLRRLGAPPHSSQEDPITEPHLQPPDTPRPPTPLFCSLTSNPKESPDPTLPPPSPIQRVSGPSRPPSWRTP